jgi:hypothetical protein
LQKRVENFCKQEVNEQLKKLVKIMTSETNKQAVAKKENALPFLVYSW